MASYTITNTAGFLSAGSGADSIYVQSGAAQGSTILGNGGNDTINFEEGHTNASAAAFSVHGGAGDDSIFIASANYSAGGGFSLLGGGGSDTINLVGSGEVASLKAGEGNDSVTWLVGGNSAEYIGMSLGSDTLHISATVAGIGMGNGHDVISGSTVTFQTAGFIKLGDGRDTINALELGGESAAYINGDTTDAGLADLIDIDSTVTSLTVRGGAGADNDRTTCARARGTRAEAQDAAHAVGTSIGGADRNSTA